jgi:hypothetical protein
MEPLDAPLPNAIDVKTSSYFPSTWRFVGVLFTVAGVAIATVNIYIGLVMIIGSILVVTTHYRIKIDFNAATYYEYTWIVGFKTGERGRFDKIQYIYINKNQVSQTMASRAQSTTVMSWEYNGYLKFSETQKIHLQSSRRKNEVVRHMQALGAQLKCEVHDLSEN